MTRPPSASRQHGRVRWLWTAATLIAWTLPLAAPHAAFAQDAPASVVKRGKAATAFVEIGTMLSGSAFCISADGLFLTNYHVVMGADAGAELKLVLDPGTAEERSYEAEVVHTEPENDLAVVRAKAATKLQPLELGDSAKLEETSLVTAFGFPFGRLLARDDQKTPEISVNQGAVAALRRERGRLAAIQIDAAVNPGNSGGPVLDASGKVVGIVTSGVFGARVSFAIPVEQARAMLSKPLVAMTPTALAYRERRKEVEFTIPVAVFGETPRPDSVELTLFEKGKRRPAPAAIKTDEGWKVKTAPLSPLDQPRRVKIESQDESGAATSSVEVFAAALTIGGVEFDLEDVERLERRGDVWIAVFAQGRKSAGKVTGLDALKSSDGKVVDLSKAAKLLVRPTAPDPASVSYELVAKTQGQVSFRKLDKIGFRDAPALPSAAGEEARATLDEIAFEIPVDGRAHLQLTPGGVLLTHIIGLKEDHATPYVEKPLKINGRDWRIQWLNRAETDDYDWSDVLPLPIGLDDWELRDLTVTPHGGQPGERRGPVNLFRTPECHVLLIWDLLEGAAVYKGKFVRKRITPEEQAKRASAKYYTFSVKARVDGEDEFRLYADRATWNHRTASAPVAVTMNEVPWDTQKSPSLRPIPDKLEFPPVGSSFADAELVSSEGRGFVLVQPAADHIWVYFDDPGAGGGDYEVVLRVRGP